MAAIRPEDLPAAANVNDAAAIMVDNGTAVEKATPVQIVDTAAPVASQADAEAGSDNSKRMTALRVAQHIAGQTGGISLGSALNQRAAASALGVAGTASNLGTFTEGIIPADQTAKQAIQVLETAVANIAIISLNPMHFGATGLGTGNDGPALNAMFDQVRALLTLNPYSVVIVNGGNKLYRTTDSIDMTGLQAWNLTVSSLYLIGACTGKAVIDAIGSRGYTLESVGVWGEKANRPAVAFQAQRGTPGGFADNASFKEFFTDGYFTRAAVHDYGQETTVWDHCTIYNRDHTARVAIHEGYNGHPMASDYASVMSGGTSFINKYFQNCDWRYLPAQENIAAITGVTNAASAVITAPGHGFAVGDAVVFQYVGGMNPLAGKIGTVTATTTNSLTVNVDTSAMGAYTSGGAVIRRAVQSPIYISRCEGFSTESCYVVSYGRPPIEVGFPEPAFQRVERLDFVSILFEGAGQSCEIFFNNSAPVTVQGFTLTTYNHHAFDALIDSTGGAGNIVTLYSPRIESYDPIFTTPLVKTPASFAAYGATITYGSLALVGFETWASFNGVITSIATGKNTQVVGDAIYLNNKRFKLDGTFGNDGTGVFINIILDGVTYKFRPQA